MSTCLVQGGPQYGRVQGAGLAHRSTGELVTPFEIHDSYQSLKL